MTEPCFVYQYNSPLGHIILQCTEKELTNVAFSDIDVAVLSVNRRQPIIQQAVDWLDQYFAGKNPQMLPPLGIYGTSFQVMVWHILQKIPYGKTVSYKDIAQEINRMNGGGHMSAQAVGGAVARNPLAVFVPCHRVIGTNGNLTGYAGKLWRKAMLLKLEQTDMPDTGTQKNMPDMKELPEIVIPDFIS